MFDRLEYWRSIERTGPVWQPDDLLYHFDVDRPFLAPIRAEAFGVLARSLSGGQSPVALDDVVGVCNRTTAVKVDVANNLDAFVRLERHVLNLLRARGLAGGVVGIQFPIDIRVVHPTPPPGYLDRRDAVDFLHCDPWRGEPDDIVNCILYLEGGADTSQTELWQVPPDALAGFIDYQGAEQAAEGLLADFPLLTYPHGSGEFLLFDAYLPHRAKRNGDKIRISLNFSLRRRDSYSVVDERWDRPRQAWHKFWNLPDGEPADWPARWQAEVRGAARSSNEAALPARCRMLETLYGIPTAVAHAAAAEPHGKEG